MGNFIFHFLRVCLFLHLFAFTRRLYLRLCLRRSSEPDSKSLSSISTTPIPIGAAIFLLFCFGKGDTTEKEEKARWIDTLWDRRLFSILLNLWLKGIISQFFLKGKQRFWTEGRFSNGLVLVLNGAWLIHPNFRDNTICSPDSIQPFWYTFRA